VASKVELPVLYVFKTVEGSFPSLLQVSTLLVAPFFSRTFLPHLSLHFDGSPVSFAKWDGSRHYFKDIPSSISKLASPTLLLQLALRPPMMTHASSSFLLLPGCLAQFLESDFHLGRLTQQLFISRRFL